MCLAVIQGECIYHYMTPCTTHGFNGDFPFDISGCHEACFPAAKFPGGANSATCLKELLVQLYTPQYNASSVDGDQYPVAILRIQHETNGDLIATSVEWMECTECAYNWTGNVRPHEPISWYKPSDESIEPWCLEVIEPSGLLMADNTSSYGTGQEVDEAFQWIIRFWSKNQLLSDLSH